MKLNVYALLSDWTSGYPLVLRIAFDDTLRYDSPRISPTDVLPPPEGVCLLKDVVDSKINTYLATLGLDGS